MNYFKFGIKLTVILFAIGTIIVVLFFFTYSKKIALIGYSFIGVSIIVSWMYTAVLLFVFVMRKITLKETLKTIGVLLLNIPVAMLYVYLVMLLLSYAKITFTNVTGKDIPLLRIEGCEAHQIKDLKNGDSETVWIKIPSDCEVNIEYEVSGVKKREQVVGYLMESGGIKATYEIGNNKEVRDNL